MKNKLRVPERRLPDEGMPLPDPPLIPLDVPTQPCAVLTRSEFLSMMEAHHIYQVARADFEKKRAAVTLKLLLGAELDCKGYEDYEVEFNQHGGLIVIDKGSDPRERTVIGEGDSHPAFIR
jgi:hypothetical protein